MNREGLTAEGKETYSDHCEKDTDGTKNRLCWGDTGDLLCKVGSLDSHTQRGESAVPPIRSSRLGIHATKYTWLKKTMWGGCEEEYELETANGHLAIARLGRTAPSDEENCIRGRCTEG